MPQTVTPGSFTFSFIPRCFKYSDVNVDGARRIARIAREMGVEKLVHVSHINASPNPTPIYIPGGSDYLKTKVSRTRD